MGLDITDQVAKESKDSNASSHELHDKDTGAKSGGSLSAAAAHKSAPVCLKYCNVWSVYGG